MRICKKIKPANINNANYYNVVGIVCRRLELLDEATWNSKKALQIDKSLVAAKMNIANIEYPGILKRMLNFSLKRCKPYGYITLIHRPARISEILSILKNGAGDIKILPIVSSNRKSASRIIIRTRK